jgi:hypothetical protein
VVEKIEGLGDHVQVSTGDVGLPSTTQPGRDVGMKVEVVVGSRSL